MWVLLRPGPYVCAEWDWGGSAFLSVEDPGYQGTVYGSPVYERGAPVCRRLSQEVVPLQCDHGGPILMVQVENEYGSYANDRKYLEAVHAVVAGKWDHGAFLYGGWAYGFYAGSGQSGRVCDRVGQRAEVMRILTLRRAAIPNVPAFSSETYPGWLTHWKEKWQRPDTAGSSEGGAVSVVE